MEGHRTVAQGNALQMQAAVRNLGALLSADEKHLLDPIHIAKRLHEHDACFHDGKTITRRNS